MIERLRRQWETAPDAPVLIWEDHAYDARRMLTGWQEAGARLDAAGIGGGEIVVLKADFSPAAIAAFAALAERECIILPVLPAGPAADYGKLAGATWQIVADGAENPDIRRSGHLPSRHDLLDELRQRGHPGLILATSGTTGEAKLILHDLHRFLKKFDMARKPYSTLAFLLFDHVAGLDTLFYTLFSGGTLVVPRSRRADAVCRAVAEHQAAVLPASPSFLNLLLLSEYHRRYDLSSLKIITFGSEPMPPGVLQRLQAAFPDVQLVQKYGISELGAPLSRCRPDNPLWIQFDPQRFPVRIEAGRLWIKAPTAMMGYLNRENAFRDGWFDTGDRVEIDESGEYLRILGRDSDMINVGGEKVFPAEIENVLLQIPGVRDVAVGGEAHLLLGNMVVARLQMRSPVSDKTAEIRRIRDFCRERLADYKIPQKFIFTEENLFTARQKKKRPV